MNDEFNEGKKNNMSETKEMTESKPQNKINEESENLNEPKEIQGINDLQEELQKTKEKLSQSESQYVRALADYQNLQKRSIQEKEDLYKYAAQKTIEVLLPALDTFDYAKSSVKPDSKVEKIVEDFNLVFEMLLKCLKDIGLEPIEETGVPFDPFYHEPLHQIPTNELPDHTVMQILKKGYILNKKVIRPAVVSVSIRQEENKGSEN